MEGRMVGTNQQIINVYHFHGVEAYVVTIEDLNEVVDAFVATRQGAVLQILSQSYELLGYTAKDFIGGLSVIRTVPANTVGLRVGPASPAQLPLSIKLIRSLTVTQSGGKRYSPIMDSDIFSDGSLSGAQYQGYVDTLQAALVLTLAVPAEGDVLTPIILGKPTPLQPTLRLNPIAQAIFTQATTQKSRQRGRGQ